MRKVAFGSDFHVDITKQSIVETVKDYLKKNKVDIFCYAGDMSSKISLTLQILREIRDDLGVVVRAVPGNHEMWDESFGSSFEALRHFNLEGKDVSVQANPYEFDDWVILGNMGWYDYSTAPSYFTHKQLDKMSYRRAVWYDKHFCRWEGKTNPEVASILIEELKNQLEFYQSKKIILLSHIVPYQQSILYKNDNEWDYYNAFIGNTTIGLLADRYHVKIAHFGHTHIRSSKQSPAGVEILCSPLGYYGEWTNEDRNLRKEIEKCIPIYEL